MSKSNVLVRKLQVSSTRNHLNEALKNKDSFSLRGRLETGWKLAFFFFYWLRHLYLLLRSRFSQSLKSEVHSSIMSLYLVPLMLLTISHNLEYVLTHSKPQGEPVLSLLEHFRSLSSLIITPKLAYSAHLWNMDLWGR